MKFIKEIKKEIKDINSNKPFQFLLKWFVIVSVIVLNIFLAFNYFSVQNKIPEYNQKLNEMTFVFQKEKERNTNLEFDRIRLQNSSNILLAIQDHYFEKNTFPNSLENLKKVGYLDANSSLNDPNTNQPYFYEKREQDFVFCVWLSDMLKGVNTTSCPSLNSKESSVIEQKKIIIPIKNKTIKLEIVGNTTFVNVRAEPNTSSTVITKVNSGDIFIFEDTKDDWYKITVTAEKVGWVYGGYVKVLQNP